MNAVKTNAATHAILGFGALATGLALVYTAQGFSGLMSGFTAWGLAPYAALLVASFFAPTHRRALATLIISGLATVFALFVYCDAALLSTSSTSALVFVFAPLYQLLVAARKWRKTAGLKVRVRRFTNPVSSAAEFTVRFDPSCDNWGLR